ncbi:uncharacterized protein M6B38_255505 [Iris pallida]|uniref:Uncharacterized protein n=1 Tax=Iris pallida TaxID=29817 RepID=A0AAX6IGD6_IRIPA|nr:uncharacterized protein M6B38_255505 [Iris pallida]
MKRRIMSYGIGLSRQNPLFKPHQLHSSSSSSSILTPEELSEIHSLTHRLCDANRLHDAVRLLDASLLALPSPSSLPVPVLVDRLSSDPSLAPSMSLLTSLRHNPNALPSSALPSCSALLLSSFLRKRRFAHAWKLFSWFLRGDGDSPCRPHDEMYRIAVAGFCAGWRAREGVRAAREMVRDGLGVGEEERRWLRRSLLREARVDEALEVDAAVAAGDGEEIGRLLDRIIRDWQD